MLTIQTQMTKLEKLLIIFLILSLFIRCNTRQENYNYKIKDIIYDDYQEIKLLDKTENEIFIIHYNQDGDVVAVSVQDKKRGFSFVINFTENNIHSFSIHDKKSTYSNLSNFDTVGESDFIMKRQEHINGFETNEEITMDGLVITESKIKEREFISTGLLPDL
jgi:hypothetical protein